MTRTYGGWTAKELLEMEAAATPGPWVMRRPWAGFCAIESGKTTVYHTATAGCPHPAEDHMLTCVARNALRLLIEHVQELESRVTYLQADLASERGKA